MTALRTDITAEKYRTFAASHPDQAQYFQPVLDVLEYSPSRLEMVPNLILVEGKNDFYTLRYADRAYRDGKLCLYPGGGAGTLDSVIALYLSWGRNLVVLLDSDSEGTRQHERYVERFGEILANRIFGLADLAPALAGQSLDAVFNEGDRDAFASATRRPSGACADKKTFYRAVQEVVAANTVVRLSSAAETSLRAVLMGLNAPLAREIVS